MLAGIHAAGHEDVTTAMIALFRFAGVKRPQAKRDRYDSALSKQATNDMLRELERLGYVERHPDPTDGRARIIQLTARGHALDTAVWTAGRAVEQSWRQRFDDEQWTTFNAVLDKLIAATE